MVRSRKTTPKKPKKKAAAKEPSKATTPAAMEGAAVDGGMEDEANTNTEVSAGVGGAIQTEPEKASSPANDSEQETPQSYTSQFREKVEEKKLANMPLDKLAEPVLDSETGADMPLPSRQYLGNLRRTLDAALKYIDKMVSHHNSKLKK